MPLEGFDDVELKRGRGQPEKELDLELVERAAGIGCTSDEISALLGVSRATLYNHMKNHAEVQAAMDYGRDKGQATLRRHQWQRATQGSDTMLIWLGKQLLKQRDTQALQQLDKDGNPTDPVVPVVKVTFSDG